MSEIEIETETKNPPPPSPQPDPKRQKISSDEDTNQNPSTIPKTPKYKRRKIAIFFAYLGVNYQGMQKNPGAKTIEGDLEEALYQSKSIPDEERNLHKRYDWARSARTDKGVSAVGQVVSGRFYVDPPGFIERLQSNLCPQIKIFGFKRATPSFNAKKFCDRRRYVYLVPVFALDGMCHRDRESVVASLGSGSELVKCVECSERGRKVFGVMGKRRFESKKCIGSGEEGNGEVNGDVGNVEMEVGEEEEGIKIESLGNGNVSESSIGIENVGNVKNVGCEEEGVKIESLGNGDVGNVKMEVGDEGGLGVEEEGVKIESLENGTVKMELGEEDVLGDSDVLGKDGVVKSKNGNADADVNELDCEDMNGGVKLEKERKFCYGEKEKERLNRILKYFVGTHNFHNFTTRTKAEDPAAIRYILSFNANTVVNVDGIEFVKCEVVGQSFMLHQIRKMIGLAVAIMRNIAPESLIETAFDKKVNITVPMAPEVGLYLDECFFTSYNNKWKHTHEELSMKDYAEEAEEFKMKHIYSHIASTEYKDGSVALWLHSLNYRNYPDLRYAINIPSSKEAESVPSSQEAESVPSSNEAENVPSSKEVENVPSSKEVETVPSSNEVETVPSSNEVETVPSSKEVENVPSSKEAENVPSSKEAENVPSSKEAENVVLNSKEAENVVPSSKEAENVVPSSNAAENVPSSDVNSEIVDMVE